MFHKKLQKGILAVVLAASYESASAISVTGTDDGTLLANTILGSGITISNVNYSDGSNAVQSGTFSGGLSSGLSMDKGIIMTTGFATDAPGPNTSDSLSKNTNAPGDADLSALSGNATNDAAVLKFDFDSTGGNLFFNFQFASEEYNEYTNSKFNDVFAFFLDGTNIALIPGTTEPVSINTVNGGNPLGTNASNPGLFNNNDPSDGGPFFDLQYDGFTDMFTAKAMGLTAGTHSMELAIADASDSSLDSAVFIQANSLSDIPPTASVPEPTMLALVGLGLLLAGPFAGRIRRQSQS